MHGDVPNGFILLPFCEQSIELKSLVSKSFTVDFACTYIQVCAIGLPSFDIPWSACAAAMSEVHDRQGVGTEPQLEGIFYEVKSSLHLQKRNFSV